MKVIKSHFNWILHKSKIKHTFPPKKKNLNSFAFHPSISFTLELLIKTLLNFSCPFLLPFVQWKIAQNFSISFRFSLDLRNITEQQLIIDFTDSETEKFFSCFSLSSSIPAHTNTLLSLPHRNVSLLWAPWNELAGDDGGCWKEREKSFPLFHANQSSFPYLISLSETFHVSPSSSARVWFVSSSSLSRRWRGKWANHRQQPAARISLSVAFASIIFTSLCSRFLSLFSLLLFFSLINVDIRFRFHVDIIAHCRLSLFWRCKLSSLTFHIPITLSIQFDHIMCVWAEARRKTLCVRRCRMSRVEKFFMCHPRRERKSRRNGKSKSSNIGWNCCRKEILITFNILSCCVCEGRERERLCVNKTFFVLG